jgi:hypothetical protein
MDILHLFLSPHCLLLIAAAVIAVTGLGCSAVPAVPENVLGVEQLPAERVKLPLESRDGWPVPAGENIASTSAPSASFDLAILPKVDPEIRESMKALGYLQ